MQKAFKGELSFLSNSHPIEGGVEYEGARYPTVENAFQAAKAQNPEERTPFETCTPASATRLGRKVQLRDNWDYARVGIMKELVRAKFLQPDLGAMLLATGEEPLQETNSRHDNYWGSCICARCKTKDGGLNWLGRIWMSVRKELQQG
jgi:Uncharacterized protein conserved in bacteria